MVIGNMKFISRVDQDIPLVRFAHSWDILVNIWNEFHISAHPCILYFFVLEALSRIISLIYLLKI